MPKTPKGWNPNHPHGCWMDDIKKPTHGLPYSGEVQWFNTLAEAEAHAHTLDWWVISQPFAASGVPDLWRVEEMDGARG